ncbi:DUF2997 domain-containing protein [Paenibacillus sp. Leaf72]|uniref:DUF2997 domain-containing protein n=1 Tax=Paenibacillus sp. Leaf72 TaxID=1736234 RepID=UPI0006F5D640|nr:DUF2997 domain-containing protein [Paenibacillus sp. Leaf72]KQN96862.1 hypothetical protein ASF12_22600 [Paenibacillus sp. Leaf72]
MKEIEFTFKNDGSVSIEAIGFKGQGCEEATKAFEQALGQLEKRSHKPEYQVRVQLQNHNSRNLRG